MLLASSILIAYVAGRLRLPVIVGFILTGVFIGPYALGLIRDLEAVEVLSEIGVVLLLFTIGLEFSLQSLFRIKKFVFGAGTIQVVLTTVIVALAAKQAGLKLQTASFWGMLLALSSTAIVLKSYATRAETDTYHGQLSLGILLFQDLCVLPIMVIVPILGGTDSDRLSALLAKLAAAIAGIAVTIITAQKLVPKALEQVVRLRSREVFVGFSILVCLGTAWITSMFGLSLALGAFLAGLVLSESEYSHQIVADILPFRDVASSIFFISVGMLLDLRELLHRLDLIPPLLAILIVVKTVVITGSAIVVGSPLRSALISGLGLAQIGEFSFIVAKVGLKGGLLDANGYQTFLGLSILSMIITPFLIQIAPLVGYRLQSLLSVKIDEDTSKVGRTLAGHVVIAGYGLNGKHLSLVLRRAKIPHVAIDFNPDQVASARQKGEPVKYGDCTQREVLHAIGIEHARIFVIAISDAAATRRAVAIAREMNPQLEIIVRTRFMSEIQELLDIGANQVVSEEFETSIEIFSLVLRHYGIAHREILREVSAIRSKGYQMLRRSTTDRESDIAPLVALSSTETIQLPEGCAAHMKTISNLDIRKRTGASIVAVVHQGETIISPEPDYRLTSGDAVVLLGSPESIEKAIELLCNRQLT